MTKAELQVVLGFDPDYPLVRFGAMKVIPLDQTAAPGRCMLEVGSLLVTFEQAKAIHKVLNKPQSAAEMRFRQGRKRGRA